MVDEAGIRYLYETYIDTVENLTRKRKPGEGLLGLKGGPADDPCHDRFVDALSEAVRDFAAQEPTSAECTAVLTYMYSAPLLHREPRSAFWMLLAVQGLSLDLIKELEPTDAASLRASYEKAYPRRKRLPVQEKVLAALKAASRNGQ